MPAGQGAELLDQLRGFPLRQELGGQHGVGQELQLRQIEEPGAEGVAGVFSRGTDDVAAEVLQALDVPVQAFAFRVDPLLLQMVQQLIGSDGMGLVRILLQIVFDDQKLQLLVFHFRHSDHLRSIISQVFRKR